MAIFLFDKFGREKEIGLLPHGLAPVGDGNYLIDSRLTAAVQVYRQKLWLLQRARPSGAFQAVTHPLSRSL
ncbi:hypothetical protein B5F94_12035 [Flavonifractor sp. An4]|nr:hypothetical protein B5F94_12035 [Flavonifractor sp. An4]